MTTPELLRTAAAFLEALPVAYDNDTVSVDSNGGDFEGLRLFVSHGVHTSDLLALCAPDGPVTEAELSAYHIAGDACLDLVGFYRDLRVRVRMSIVNRHLTGPIPGLDALEDHDRLPVTVEQVRGLLAVDAIQS